jgi:hypothetical protein
MKKKNSKQSDQTGLTGQTARRLASYSMAAGLGAFGCGEAAQGAIVYTDVPDIVLMRGDAAVNLNLDNDPTGKLDLHLKQPIDGQLRE